MSGTGRRIIMGFVAGAIAVVVAHQTMILVLHLLGFLPNFPWSLRPNAWGVPQLLNQMFWGGVWGMVFGLVAPFLGGLKTWALGLVMGMGGNAILGNWILLPLVFNRGTFMAGYAPQRMIIGLLIGGAFGLGWAYIFRALYKRR